MHCIAVEVQYSLIKICKIKFYFYFKRNFVIDNFVHNCYKLPLYFKQFIRTVT